MDQQTPLTIEQATTIAEELDRRSLLYNSRGDRALTAEELEPVIRAVQEATNGKNVHQEAENL